MRANSGQTGPHPVLLPQGEGTCTIAGVYYLVFSSVSAEVLNLEIPYGKSQGHGDGGLSRRRIATLPRDRARGFIPRVQMEQLNGR